MLLPLRFNFVSNRCETNQECHPRYERWHKLSEKSKKTDGKIMLHIRVTL